VKTALPGTATWQPLLDGDLRDRALETVHAIAQDLRDRDTGVEHATLAGGRSGLALFYAYLAQSVPGQGHELLALRMLDQSIEALSSTPMNASLYSGFTGIAWTTHHLRGRLLEAEADDSNGEIDDVLAAHVGRSPWRADYDLIIGLVGLGLYAADRLPREAARTALTRIVDRLDETAVRLADGITWRTPPELLPPWQRELAPQGYYNAGLAHGVPGIVAILGDACAEDVARPKAAPLLDGAAWWLIRQKLPSGRFPSWIPIGADPSPSRAAWCYGDPGIAAALLYAARRVGNRTWEAEAIRIALKVASLPPESAGVRDAGICHGAAGLAHIYNRLYQATGETPLRDAALFWLRRTLEMRTPGRGVAGYQSYFPEPNGTPRWVDEPGLLTGAAGIGLALLAASAPIEPAWDRFLLLSTPPALRSLPNSLRDHCDGKGGPALRSPSPPNSLREHGDGEGGPALRSLPNSLRDHCDGEGGRMP
jgi:lantibiotic modifying enzyme